MHLRAANLAWRPMAHSRSPSWPYPTPCAPVFCRAPCTCSAATPKIKLQKRVHGLPEPSEPKNPQADVIDWVNKTLAEEWAGSPAGDLGSGEADRAFVRQVLTDCLALEFFFLGSSFLCFSLAFALSLRCFGSDVPYVCRCRCSWVAAEAQTLALAPTIRGSAGLTVTHR